MIIHTGSENKTRITRAGYTRQVWKHNHYAWGRWTPGCWNTVHCGKRDVSYGLYLSQATSSACQIMKLTPSEFQFLFEKTDQGGAVIFLEGGELYFNWKGKTYTFHASDTREKVVERITALELFGNADAHRMEKKKAEEEAKKAAAKSARTPSVKGLRGPSPELRARREAAVARTASLMRPDYVAPEKGERVVFDTPKKKKKKKKTKDQNAPVPDNCAEILHGCPKERVREFRIWCRPYREELKYIKLAQRIARFLEAVPVAQGDMLALAQMFAPMPEFLLLPAPKFVLPVPLPLAPVFKLPLPIHAEKAVSDTEKAPIVAISSQVDAKPSHTLTLKKSTKAEKQEPRPVLSLRKPRVSKPRPGRVRKLVERDEKGDVPFYGMRRRTQAQFRTDVALNCFDRCVISSASLIRCEAAHLLAHARKGGASFKNGLLLRADLHTLFDAGECAIDPQAMTVHFSLSILESDPDLAAYEGKAITTLKPINTSNLEERWTAFLTVYMATDSAA